MSKHLKAYAAPKSWTILRKVHKWILRPQPGAHPLERAMPIGLLLKQLGCGKTTREAKKILNDKTVTVNGRIIKDVHTGVGFTDAISIKPDKHLRCTMDKKGRLQFINAPQEEMNKMLCKITNKTTIKGGKTQLNLSNGTNILVEKGTYATGDTLLLETPSHKIIEHIPFAKGNLAFLTGGKHISTIGMIEEIKDGKVWCAKDKGKVETLKEFAFIIGKDKPIIKI